MAEFRNKGNFKAGASVLVNKEGLVRVLDLLVVLGLVVLSVGRLSTLLVEAGQRRLGEVDTVNLVGLLVVGSDNSSTGESLLHSIITITVLSFSLGANIVHQLKNRVSSHHFKAHVDVQKTALLFHYKPAIEARPHLDVVRRQRVRISLIKGLLPDGLEAK